MPQELVDKLTSRKFLICIFVMLLALVGYGTHQIDYNQLLNVAMVVAGIFSGAEGAVDAIAALRPRPTPNSVDTTVVNVPPSGVH